MAYRGKRKSHRGLNTRNVRNATLKQREQHKAGQTFKANMGAIFTGFAQVWVALPSFHRKSISIIFILWLMVLIWSPEENTNVEEVKSNEVVILPLKRLDTAPISDMDLGYVDHDSMHEFGAVPTMEMTLDDESFEPEPYRQTSRPSSRDLQTDLIYDDLDMPFDDEAYVQDIRIEDARSNEVIEQAPVSAAATARGQWLDYTVVSGDNMTKIFRRNQLQLKDLYAILAVEGRGKPLSRLYPGQNLRFRISPNDELVELKVEAAGRESIIYVRNAKAVFERI